MEGAQGGPRNRTRNWDHGIGKETPKDSGANWTHWLQRAVRAEKPRLLFAQTLKPSFQNSMLKVVAVALALMAARGVPAPLAPAGLAAAQAEVQEVVAEARQPLVAAAEPCPLDRPAPVSHPLLVRVHT